MRKPPQNKAIKVDDSSQGKPGLAEMPESVSISQRGVIGVIHFRSYSIIYIDPKYCNPHYREP